MSGPRAAALHQARLLRSLVLRARGRLDGVPPGATAIPYGRDGRALGLALLAASLVEVVVLELVVPWPLVRAVLLAVGVYGVVLVLASLADLAVRPHVVTDDALRLRLGGWADVTVPLSAVASVGTQVRSAEGLVTMADEVLTLSVANLSHLEVRLRQPRELHAGPVSGAVRSIRVSADDPGAAAAAVRAALARVQDPAP